jgi:hypothetical protein
VPGKTWAPFRCGQFGFPVHLHQQNILGLHFFGRFSLHASCLQLNKHSYHHLFYYIYYNYIPLIIFPSIFSNIFFSKMTHIHVIWYIVLP